MAKVTDLNKYKKEIPGAAEALELMAKLAREGKLRCAAVVALEHDQEDTHALYFSEGTTFEQIWLLGALSHAAQRVTRNLGANEAVMGEDE